MKENFIDLILKNFLKALFALSVLGIFFYIMMPFMIYLVLGGILAMALTPFVDFFMGRGLSRNLSLIVFSSLLLFLGLIPVIGFFVRGSKVVTEFFHKSDISQLSQKFTQSIYTLIHNLCSLYGLNEGMVRAKYDATSAYLASTLSASFAGMVYQIPEIVMGGLITVLSVYCFLKESGRIRTLFNRYFYFSQRNGDQFVMMLKACCREVFFSNIITGLLQAGVVSLGALAFGIGDVFLVFFITFIVSFIPIIGAAPVAVVLAVLCFMDSRSGAGFGMLAVAAFSGVSDNLIRPLLGSLGVVEVHPFIGLLSVIGGVIMFGLPGLFLGPLITSLVFGALPIIIDEYFPLAHKSEGSPDVKVETIVAQEVIINISKESDVVKDLSIPQ
jgi:predicted PurR-regulated permease PerM